MPDAPLADLCVQRDPAQSLWRVILCDGDKPGQMLASFPTFAGAAEFALQERDRRQAVNQPVQTVHFPDDCPCYRSGGCTATPCGDTKA